MRALRMRCPAVFDYAEDILTTTPDSIIRDADEWEDNPGYSEDDWNEASDVAIGHHVRS